MTLSIHPTAQVSPKSELGDDVFIGPYCVVGEDVVIGARTRLEASVIVYGPTSMGPDNVVFPFAVLGSSPQDRTYAGEPTTLLIGGHNVFREHVTVHRGTVKGGGVTRVGSHSLFMAGTHLAHDVSLGDRLTLANATLLGGHVCLEEGVTTGGQVAIAPFVRVGKRAFLAAGAKVEQDVPPFVIAAGDRARVRALNRVGLARGGVPDASQQALAQAFTRLFRKDTPRSIAVRALVTDEELCRDAYVAELLAFVTARL